MSHESNTKLAETMIAEIYRDKVKANAMDALRKRIKEIIFKQLVQHDDLYNALLQQARTKEEAAELFAQQFIKGIPVSIDKELRLLLIVCSEVVPWKEIIDDLC